MRLEDLSDTLLREVCECLATDRDMMEEFVEAFGFPKDILKDFPLRKGTRCLLKDAGDILFGILKKHPSTPVQLLRNVCASLLYVDFVVDLLDVALRSYKPGPSLHLVRLPEEIRRIYNERIQRKPITYLQRGAILIMDHMKLPVGNEIKSFFMDLDPTSEVTRLSVHTDLLELDRTLLSWQQNQGQ